jgi:hypothetical protein
MPAHGAVCAGPLPAAMMPAHALGWGPFVVARHACACPPSGPFTAGIWVCALPLPLPWAAMPRALQSWLPQPRLRVRGQASGSLSGERRSVCGWRCFSDCGHDCDRDNDNVSTTTNAITMTRPGWLRRRRRRPNNDGRDDASTTTMAATRAPP